MRYDPTRPVKYTIDAETGCWLFSGSLNNKGYGQMFRGSPAKRWLAHRYMFEKIKGPIPQGMTLDHAEGCPKHCINPDHLTIRTHRDNIRTGPHVRLTLEDAKAIRTLASSMPLSKIASLFEISGPHTSNIVAGKKWQE